MQPRVWQVTGFETRVCAEGQVGITVVCSKIEYAGDAPAGRPSSLALKMSHTDARSALFAPFYEKEVFFYTGWGDAMAARVGINIPQALAAWQVAPAEGKGLEECCIMFGAPPTLPARPRAPCTNIGGVHLITVCCWSCCQRT